MAMTNTEFTGIDRIDRVMAGNLTRIAGRGDATRGRSDRGSCPISIPAPRAGRARRRATIVGSATSVAPATYFGEFFAIGKIGYRLLDASLTFIIEEASAHALSEP
jgi:hypothetical protein